MSANLLSAIKEDIRMKVLALKNNEATRKGEIVKDIEVLIVIRNSLVKTSK